MPSLAYRAALLLFGLLAICAAGLGADDPPENVLREGFESETTSWRREETDASVTIEAHERSNRAAHEGRMSERIAFRAGAGSVLFYSQSLPKVPVSEALRVSVYVRSNRPGVQIFGRIVLPADLDPDTGRPSFVLLPGESVTVPDRWQRLELDDLLGNLDRQARVLRVGTSREVSLDGAYLERVVVNLYGGAGEAEVFLDEMSVSPAPPEEPEARPGDEEVDDAEPNPPLPGPGAIPPSPADPKNSGRVQLVGNHLYKDKIDWVPTIIDAPGADPMVLRQHGFDVMSLGPDSPDREAEEAARAGLLLMPTLPSGSSITPEAAVAAAGRHPQRDHVAFWNLGDDLGHERDIEARKARVEWTRGVVSGLRDLPEGQPRLSFGTVLDYLPQYALVGRNLDLLGIEATDWATIRDPYDTYRFLNQRRDLTAVKNPHAPHLAWINASAPLHAARNIWGYDDPPIWGRPQVQPEQIRQQAFAALSAGYRAIGVRADSEITSPSGLPRLFELAFLNAEIDLVESLIARGSDPIQLWPTFPKDLEIPMAFNPLGTTTGFQRNNPATRALAETLAHPTIKAASIPTFDGRGRLLLVVDYATGSQYQPPQMALNDLGVMVPAPENAVGLEITPAGVEVLRTERSTGGRKFILPLFNGTAMILVTTDLTMKSRLEAEVAKIAPMATEFAIRQAMTQIREATEINGLLARDGHPVRDADDLIRQANEILKSANDARERMDYTLSWSESQRVGRSIRHLKRMHFDKAFREMFRLTYDLARAEERKPPYPLIYPIASPPLTAFQTLPQHFIWMSWIRGEVGRFGENLLPSGSFDLEDGRGLAEEGWTDISHTNEDVETKINLVKGQGYGDGSDGLRLGVAPKSLDPKAIDKLIPYLDHKAVAIRSPPIKVHRGGLFRIRFLIRLTRAMPPGTGGLIVRDSLGGEPYQFRMTDPCPLWREVTLYRFAPDDGEMTITLGLAGYGEAWFDRLRVDTVTAGEPPSATPTPPPPETSPIARRPGPARTNPSAPSEEETRPRR